MVKSVRGEKAVLRKGPWSREEDEKLMAYIQQHGHGSWCSLPAKAGLERCGKSCRLRWINYLRPDIKRGNFSLQEDHTIIQLHALLGSRWSAIALHLPKRTDNEIKNHWHTHLKKRLTKMGIDPTTHKPMNNAHAANLNHMAQWETARLQAEARMARQSKLLGSCYSQQHSPAQIVLNKITPPSSLPPCLDVFKAWQNSWSSSTPKSSTPTTISTAENIYAMMLATDYDFKSPASTLCFPGTIFINSNSTDNSNMTTSGVVKEGLLPSSTCANAGLENSVGSLLGDGDDIMVAVQAFRSEGYNSLKQNMGGVLNVGEEGSTNFEEKHDWETILNLVNDFPSDHLHFPCLI